MILITNNMEPRPGQGGTAIHLKDDIYIDADYLEEIANIQPVYLEKIADIQPVQEGRWENDVKNTHWGHKYCSVCGKTMRQFYEKYCGNCGAKMQEE